MITGCICMLASCKNGNSYNNGKDGLDPNKPTVTVTIEPFRYFVEQIAGNDVNVNVMVPAICSTKYLNGSIEPFRYFVEQIAGTITLTFTSLPAICSTKYLNGSIVTVTVGLLGSNPSFPLL